MYKKTPQEFIHQNPECEKIYETILFLWQTNCQEKKEKEATDEKRLTVNIIQKHYEPPCLESGLKTPTVFFLNGYNWRTLNADWLFNNIKEISVILTCIKIECYKSLPFNV